MKYITLFRRAALPALMAAALCACTDRTEELGGDDGRKPDLGQITPAVVYNAPEDIDGPVRDIADGMTFYFARNDYEGRANRGTVCAEPIPGTIDNNLDGYNILFNPVQYYDGKMTTQMQGWYPEGGVYDEGGGYPEVEFEIDGSQDIMMSNVLEGTMADRGIDYQERDDHRFVFEHQLTQLQFYVKGSALAIAQWGTIQKIELLKEANSCVLYLPLPKDESCTSDFKGSATLSVKGTALTIAQENTEYSFGEPVMIEPRTIGVRNTLTLRITGANKTAEVVINNKTHENVEFAAGYATKVVLELLPEDVKFNFIPTEWRSKNVTVDLGTQTYPYVPEETLCIVSRDLRGIISTKQ